MAQETINVGTTPNDNTGTLLRTAWGFVNSMMTEIYAKLFETGKVLSDNNYTDAEQTKLAGIETGAQVNAANTVIDASYVHTDVNFTSAKDSNLTFLTPRIADFVPGTGAQLDRQWTRYNQYQQTGVLQIDIVSIVETGSCTLQIIKTADAITLFVGATEITTIGKLDGSSDFSTTIGDVDLVTIVKFDETTDNTTGVYYSIKNLA